MSPPVCIAIDFETAGYYRHSACAIGMARIDNGLIADEFYSLVKPPSSRICFTHIHGLGWRDLKDAPGFSEVWQSARDMLAGADYFIAHNAAFDKSVLLACCAEFGCEKPRLPFLCTLKASRQILQIPSHRLNKVCDYFGMEFNHHNALSDARACARIFLKFMKMGAQIERIML